MTHATAKEIDAVKEYFAIRGITLDDVGAAQQTHIIGKLRRGEIVVEGKQIEQSICLLDGMGV